MNFELIGMPDPPALQAAVGQDAHAQRQDRAVLRRYLLLVMVIALLAAGGFGAGMAAVAQRKGASWLARIVLTGMFRAGLLASVMPGLRHERDFLRHRAAPLSAARRGSAAWRATSSASSTPSGSCSWSWISGWSRGPLRYSARQSFWLGILAVLLLFVCNYLLARVLGGAGGPADEPEGRLRLVLLVAIICAWASCRRSLRADASKKHAGVDPVMVECSQATPPFGAAARR